jgi:hypothetical protein
MRRGRAGLGTLAAVLATALGAAGCGLGPGQPASNVTINVTRDFGTHQLGRVSANGPGQDTVVRALERRFKVKTIDGGGFVESIDGVRGGTRDGRAVDWFYYVNGVEAGKGAAATKVHKGDRIWWDNHDWQTVMRSAAVVGSWPEPFRSGRNGRRLPVRLDCASDAGKACQKTAGALQAIGVKVSMATPQTPGGVDLLRVIVGRWQSIRDAPEAGLVEKGPNASGIFARFVGGGAQLELMDSRARVTRTLSAGAGLVAATRYHDDQPVWFVTGTDDAGVLAAATALTPERLSDHFALVVARGGDRPVPEPG